MRLPIPISVLTLGLFCLQTHTANCKPLGIHSRDLQNSTQVTTDPTLMDGSTNTTTSEVEAQAEFPAGLIPENPKNVTMVVDDGNAGFAEYKPTPEEARQQHYIDEWHRQISAEVMQAMVLKKRDAEMAGPITGAEGTTGQGVSNVWKRYVPVMWLGKCWYGQWNGTTCVCENGKPAGPGLC